MTMVGSSWVEVMTEVVVSCKSGIAVGSATIVRLQIQYFLRHSQVTVATIIIIFTKNFKT
jgi:hypothetical protein